MSHWQSVGTALSGCDYDAGFGYASDNYDDDALFSDTYSDHKRNYNCDHSYRVNNIGYGGV